MKLAESTGDYHKFKELKESFYNIKKTVKVDECDHSHSHHHYSSSDEECGGHDHHDELQIADDE